MHIIIAIITIIACTAPHCEAASMSFAVNIQFDIHCSVRPNTSSTYEVDITMNDYDGDCEIPDRPILHKGFPSVQTGLSSSLNMVGQVKSIPFPIIAAFKEHRLSDFFDNYQRYKIEPYFKIQHQCTGYSKTVTYKCEVYLPQSVLSVSPTKITDLGTLELDITSEDYCTFSKLVRSDAKSPKEFFGE